MDHTFLLGSFMGEPVWMWLSFAAVVIALLVFDLGFMHRKDREVGMKESLLFSAFYISVGLLFGAWIWLELGSVKAIEYYTGFIVEKTLSIDNIFVMTMLFSFFRIPGKYQHRVLFWGVLGAIILRGLIIGLGSVLVSQFAWILDVFAVFLIFTGIKMLWTKKEEGADVGHNPILSFIQRHFRVTDGLHGHSFFVRQPSRKHGKIVIWLTPLFLSLVMIEFADVLFAVDSVPAIFMITSDTLVVYTSNIFAILGLRSLYFVLAAIIERFQYLKYVLSILLIFIGGKTFIAEAMGWEKFPIGWSLGITFAILGFGMGFSFWRTQKALRRSKAKARR